MHKGDVSRNLVQRQELVRLLCIDQRNLRVPAGVLLVHSAFGVTGATNDGKRRCPYPWGPEKRAGLDPVLGEWDRSNLIKPSLSAQATNVLNALNALCNGVILSDGMPPCPDPMASG
jgi:hypothetical protein